MYVSSSTGLGTRNLNKPQDHDFPTFKLKKQKMKQCVFDIPFLSQTFFLFLSKTSTLDFPFFWDPRCSEEYRVPSKNLKVCGVKCLEIFLTRCLSG